LWHISKTSLNTIGRHVYSLHRYYITGSIAAGNSAPVVGIGAVVGSMIAVGQSEIPPPPKMAVGVSMRGAVAKVGKVGANVGVGTVVMRAGNVVAVGVGAVGKVGQKDVPPNGVVAASMRAVNPKPPPKVGVVVGTGAVIRAGNAPANVGTVGAVVGSISAVGQNPRPPMPGAKLVGVGASISAVGAVGGIGAVGRMTALASGTAHTTNAMVSNPITKFLAVFMFSFLHGISLVDVGK
jgi:hypothetical protein